MEKYFLSFFLFISALPFQTSAAKKRHKLEQQQQPKYKEKSKAISEKRHGCNVEIEN